LTDGTKEKDMSDDLDSKISLRGLKADFAEYQRLEARTNERRAKWNDETKALILSTLQKVETEIGSLQVRTNFQTTNGNAIGLCFAIAPSGIVTTDGNGIRGFTRYPAYLLYSQLANGKAGVYVIHFYVEDKQTPVPSKQIALIDPEQITEAKIYEHVSQFIKEISKEATNTSADYEVGITKIGFAAK
jgi:hypothetical protein